MFLDFQFECLESLHIVQHMQGHYNQKLYFHHHIQEVFGFQAKNSLFLQNLHNHHHTTGLQDTLNNLHHLGLQGAFDLLLGYHHRNIQVNQDTLNNLHHLDLQGAFDLLLENILEHKGCLHNPHRPGLHQEVLHQPHHTLLKDYLKDQNNLFHHLGHHHLIDNMDHLDCLHNILQDQEGCHLHLQEEDLVLLALHSEDNPEHKDFHHNLDLQLHHQEDLGYLADIQGHQGFHHNIALHSLYKILFGLGIDLPDQHYPRNHLGFHLGIPLLLEDYTKVDLGLLHNLYYFHLGIHQNLQLLLVNLKHNK